MLLIVLSSLLFLCSGCSNNSNLSSSAKDSVLFVGGGSIDDHVATVLLFTMEGIDFVGSITSNSDCLYHFAMQSQWRIQSYVGANEYPITLSNARGWNPFPMNYRKDSIKVYNSTILKGYADNGQWPPYQSGEAFLKAQLAGAVAANKPITLLITSPFTPLSIVLKENPELEKGIKMVIWMGGAINVPGNLDPATLPKELANPRAEWNAFWDPYAVDWIFKNTSVPIIVFPLDVTDQAKLTAGFMSALKGQSAQYRYSALVNGLYNLVEGQPYFEMWNSLTTVYVSRPDIFDAPVTIKLSIETEGFMQGAITQDPNGRAVSVVLKIKNSSAFYEYVLTQLRRN